MSQLSFIVALVCIAFRAIEGSCPVNIQAPVYGRIVADNPTSCISQPEIIVASASPPEYTRCDQVSSCGPAPTLEPIRSLRPLVLTPVDSPIFILPSPPLPPPAVISNKCTCTKTVLKPQLYQRLIQVQKNQRFLKKSFTPVVDKIQYDARPRC